MNTAWKNIRGCCKLSGIIHKHSTTTVTSLFLFMLHPFNSPLSGTTWVSQYHNGKTSLDLLEQEIVSGSGISWAICKSATCPRHNHAITPPLFIICTNLSTLIPLFLQLVYFQSFRTVHLAVVWMTSHMFSAMGWMWMWLWSVTVTSSTIFARSSTLWLLFEKTLACHNFKWQWRHWVYGGLSSEARWTLIQDWNTEAAKQWNKCIEVCGDQA